MLGSWTGRATGGRKPGIIFIHIPKTGGSSISSALRKHYRLSSFHIKSELTSLATEKKSGLNQSEAGFQEALQELRQSLVYYHAQKGVRFITGHFWMNRQMAALGALGYRTITCFRHPVERWFSHFFYAHYRDNPYGRIEKDIDEFLASEDAGTFGTMYVRYLGGQRDDRDYTSEQAIKTAVDNLDILSTAGFLRNLDVFQDNLREQTGINLRFGHKRRATAMPAQVKSIRDSMEYKKAVLEKCAADMDVYEQALIKFSG